jgi:hypothetical protein
MNPVPAEAVLDVYVAAVEKAAVGTHVVPAAGPGISIPRTPLNSAKA